VKCTIRPARADADSSSVEKSDDILFERRPWSEMSDGTYAAMFKWSSERKQSMLMPVEEAQENKAGLFLSIRLVTNEVEEGAHIRIVLFIPSTLDYVY